MKKLFWIFFVLVLTMRGASTWVTVAETSATSNGQGGDSSVLVVKAYLQRDTDWSNGTQGHYRYAHEATYTGGNPVGAPWATGVGNAAGNSSVQTNTASSGTVAFTPSGSFLLPVGWTATMWAESAYNTPGIGQNIVRTYSAAHTVAATYAPPSNKQIAYRIPANTGPNPVHWAIIKKSDGTLKAELTQAPGAAATYLVATGLPSTATEADYKLAYWLPGLGMLAGGSGIWSMTTTTATGLPPVGAETVFDASHGAHTSSPLVESGVAPSPTNSVPVVAPTTVPNVAVTPAGTGGTVWRIPPSGGGLSDTTFQEGINKIVDGQMITNNLLQGKGADGLGTYDIAGTDGLGGAGSKVASQAPYAALKPDGGAAVTASASSPGTLYTAQIGGRSIAIGFANLGDMIGNDVLIAGRTILLLVFAIWFAGSAGRTVQQYLIGLGSADTGGSHMGPENLVPGMSQGKHWASAGIVLTAIFAAGAAMVVAVDAWMSGKGVGIASMLSGTNFSGIGAAWGLIDRYVPATAMIQLSIARWALPYTLAPLYTGGLVVAKVTKL